MKIQVLKENSVYRVHDLLNFPDDHFTVQELLSDSRYSNTIMKKYFKNPHDKFDLEALYKIILEESKNIHLFDDSHVLMHVRTGDETVVRGLENQDNIDFYLNEIAKYPLDKTLVLVTAMHFPGRAWSLEKVQHNVELLEDFLNQIDREVLVHSNEDVDLDLMQLSLAKNLIATPKAGGFARVIIELNKIHNGRK
jgi:hypothetical protein